MRRIMFAIAIAGVLSTFCAKYGQTQENPQDPLEKIFGNTIEIRMKGKEEIIAQRKEMIDKLITLVKDPEILKKDRQAVATAIELLGEYRAVEAVPVLSKMILFDSSGEVCDRETIFEGKAFIGKQRPRAECIPAVAALTKIGMPSVKSVTTILLSLTERTKNKDSLTRHALCVIRDVMGPKMAKRYIEEIMDNDEKASKSKFLNRGIQFMNEAIVRERNAREK